MLKPAAILPLLKAPELDGRKAKEIPAVVTQLNNLLADTKSLLMEQDAKDVIKNILWGGLLNRYGTLGFERERVRTFRAGTERFADRDYASGDLLSIDFGTNNMGYEFAYTHTGLVLNNFTSSVIAIPITSYEEGRLESKPQDIRESMMMLPKKRYPLLNNDSFLLMHEMRSVSKNRITKYIGNVNDVKLIQNIFAKYLEISVDI
jgi:mRNA-degrading endonuclease toxin of MazEF toxin-antitoxin module